MLEEVRTKIGNKTFCVTLFPASKGFMLVKKLSSMDAEKLLECDHDNALTLELLSNTCMIKEDGSRKQIVSQEAFDGIFSVKSLDEVIDLLMFVIKENFGDFFNIARNKIEGGLSQMLETEKVDTAS